MYVLVAISIVAFLALVWATVAIVMHVRQAGQAKVAAAENELRGESGTETRIAEQASEEPVSLGK
jgi:hypothetical protein